MERTAIPGSAPDHSGCRRERAVDPEAPVRATIVLRPSDPGVAAKLLSGRYDPAAHTSAGADPHAMAAVEAFARDNDLVIEESDAAGRRVVVSGPSSRMGAAFGVTFGEFVSPNGVTFRGYDRDISLPSGIAKYVLAVLGLDTRPAARPRQ